DHERGTYLMKTGYRPDATVEHPSIGAICCHELPVGTTEIPRHISILPSQWPARGGFLGGDYDAFQADDPVKRLPDVTSFVAPARRTSTSSNGPSAAAARRGSPPRSTWTRSVGPGR